MLKPAKRQYPRCFFSIITISYNQGKFLRACIESVKTQSFDDYEHIIVDPGSSDCSRSLIPNHDHHIQSILEPDKGPADGLNKGFNASRGCYAFFLNADDYLLPGALETAARLLKFHSYPDLLFLGGFKLFESTSSTKRVFPGSTIGPYHALGISHFYQQGAFVNLTIFRKSNGFNISNSTCWDGELFLELLSMHGIRVFRNPLPISVFRIHSDSITGSNRSLQLYGEDSYRAVCRYYPFVLSLLGFERLLRIPFVRRSFKFLLDPMLFLWHINYFFLSRF